MSLWLPFERHGGQCVQWLRTEICFSYWYWKEKMRVKLKPAQPLINYNTETFHFFLQAGASDSPSGSSIAKQMIGIVLSISEYLKGEWKRLVPPATWRRLGPTWCPSNPNWTPLQTAAHRFIWSSSRSGQLLPLGRGGSMSAHRDRE